MKKILILSILICTSLLGCDKKHEHVDVDNNGLCDECQFKMLIEHTNHTFFYTSGGESGHYMTYTCGCPSEEGTAPHYDENQDKICDACGFSY